MKEQVHVIERLAKGTKCKDCVSFRECARDATLPAFEAGQAALCRGFAQKKPQTNADCIRAMSDEELARMLSDAVCPIVQSDDVCEFFGNCVNCWLDWLKQPVKDGDNDG